jgi:hypothetical protein
VTVSDQPATAARVFDELAASLDDIPGSRLHLPTGDVWLHTPEQIAGWLALWRATFTSKEHA